MPQNPSRITQVEHPNSPGLHRRRRAHYAGIFLREFLALDVLPPSVRILDTQAHHEIPRMLGDVKGLQQEPERSDLKFSNLFFAPIDGKSKIGIEPLGEFGILGGHERSEISHGTRIHRLLLQIRKCCRLLRVRYWKVKNLG